MRAKYTVDGIITDGNVTTVWNGDRPKTYRWQYKWSGGTVVFGAFQARSDALSDFKRYGTIEEET